MAAATTGLAALDALKEGRAAVWLRPRIAGREQLGDVITDEDVDSAAARFARFAPLLAELFPGRAWDGTIRSELLSFPDPAGKGNWLVKGDHALPMTGSIKARGGVHELLAIIERVARQANLAVRDCTRAWARSLFERYTVVVASTGNLGYSVGVVARAFGLQAEIHMSLEAKEWKKERLRKLGAQLVEHDCDYTETIARARLSANSRADAIFIDDEGSKDLLTGYAVAAQELVQQLSDREIRVGEDRPLVVYLPCGVGGAPGGITYGLKRHFGEHAVAVFVEPTASPCMMVALASDDRHPHSVYEFGCDNDTIADGLAVPRASEMVLRLVGDAIDAVVTVPDEAMVDWVRRAWRAADLRLEPSAAAAFAAHTTFTRAVVQKEGWPSLKNATYLFWATGGSMIPETEFSELLESSDELVR